MPVCFGRLRTYRMPRCATLPHACARSRATVHCLHAPSIELHAAPPNTRNTLEPVSPLLQQGRQQLHGRIPQTITLKSLQPSTLDTGDWPLSGVGKAKHTAQPTGDKTPATCNCDDHNSTADAYTFALDRVLLHELTPCCHTSARGAPQQATCM